MIQAELRLPDFIIAGAPRSATTWLYVLAKRHPQLAMARPRVPEPKFFLVDELFGRGLEYYSRNWFAALPSDRLLGEKSANYLESTAAAERIHRSLPRVKLIFLLRNPVDRAYSNYLWSRQNGLEAESFERALELEQQREGALAPVLRYARPHAYFSRGLYALHLTRFFDRFPRQQILVLRHEDVATRPETVTAAFHRFLGVVELPETARDVGPINITTASQVSPLSQALRRYLAARYRSANADLAILLGSDFEVWCDE
jgi:hypothetical protein